MDALQLRYLVVNGEMMEVAEGSSEWEKYQMYADSQAAIPVALLAFFHIFPILIQSDSEYFFFLLNFAGLCFGCWSVVSPVVMTQLSNQIVCRNVATSLNLSAKVSSGWLSAAYRTMRSPPRSSPVKAQAEASKVELNLRLKCF